MAHSFGGALFFIYLTVRNYQLFYYICSMKRLIELLKAGVQRLRKYVSPVFLALLAVSFTLWYILKLDYTYTKDMKVEVNVDGQHITVPCVVEGKGSNLLYSSSRVTIPLSDLKYDVVDVRVSPEEVPDSMAVTEKKVRIQPVSMQDAISIRYSDLKVLSVGVIPEIELPKR